MNQLLKYTLLLFLVAFAACSSEDDAVSTVPNEQPQPGDALELTVSAADFVTDGAPDTRATDNDKTTTFEDGDRVGIIILDASNNLIYDNIPYEYNSGNWTFDSGNDEGKGECYYDTKATTFIVYYPYSRAADEVRGVNDLKARFAPKFNQSDIEDYRSSDLMVWSNSSLTPPVKELNAELKHAFASFFLAPTVGKFVLEDDTEYKGSYIPEVSDISDVSLTIDNAVYIPYKTKDGTLRCIVPADITPSDIRCFYTFGSKSYGNTINISSTGVVANTRYTSAPAIETVPYSLFNAHVGDFYCKNSNDEGYLIPGDVTALSTEQQAACVGIVFWVGSEAFEQDPLLKSKRPDCSHGLAVALQDATLNSSSTNMNWSQNYEYVQNWVNLYNSSVNIQRTDIMCGYSNTLVLMGYNAQKGASDRLRVLPCDAILDYSTKNPAPTNSSDWYFPSVKELKLVYWGQEQGQGITGRNYLNNQIGISGGSPFGSDNYWSSTEHSYYSYFAWYVYFGNGTVYGSGKHYNAFRVRPLLAF